MKWNLLVAIFAAAILQAAYGSPHLRAEGSFGFNIDGQSGYTLNGFNDFFGSLNNYSLNLLDDFHRHNLSAISDFAAALGDATDKFSGDAHRLGEAFAAAIRSFFEENISNFVTTVRALLSTLDEIIKNISDGVQRDKFIRIQRELQNINNAAHNLAVVVDRVREKWSVTIENEASEIIDNWNSWAEAQLKRASKELNGDNKSYRLIADLVNDYVDSYSGYLNQCADSLHNDFKDYEQKVDDAVARYRKIVEALIKRVQICLRSENLDCQWKISSELRSLQSGAREFENLINQGKQLQNKKFIDAECAKETINKYEGEKGDILRKIEGVIQRSKGNA